MRVDDSRIRKEKVADSKISGYVWTGPNKEDTTLLKAMFVYNARREDWIQDRGVASLFACRGS